MKKSGVITLVRGNVVLTPRTAAHLSTKLCRGQAQWYITTSLSFAKPGKKSVSFEFDEDIPIEEIDSTIKKFVEASAKGDSSTAQTAENIAAAHLASHGVLFLNIDSLDEEADVKATLVFKHRTIECNISRGDIAFFAK